MSEYLVKILDRAEELNALIDSRINHLIDVEKADDVFKLDYKAWYEADDENFLHDWYGIYNNIDRRTIMLNQKSTVDNFNFFVPRFATE